MVFSRILNFFIGKFQVCTIIHTWLLIYDVPLSQTTSNNNNKNYDERIEDCRRKLKRPSRRLSSRFQLLDLSNALYDRFQQLRGIEYLEESITCCRQGLKLCPIGDPNRSHFLNNFATAITTRFVQIRRMNHLLPSRVETLSHRRSQSFTFSQ
jgi:hypothetical protein